jgi:hypothetical protein
MRKSGTSILESVEIGSSAVQSPLWDSPCLNCDRDAESYQQTTGKPFCCRSCERKFHRLCGGELADDAVSTYLSLRRRNESAKWGRDFQTLRELYARIKRIPSKHYRAICLNEGKKNARLLDLACGFK